MKMTLAGRFWAKVNKDGPVHPVLGTPCWLWTASVDHNGYGKIAIDGRTVQAHRVSWELERGPIPAGQCALHRCDNPLCVNPEHEFLGTMLENVADMDAKGRRVNSSSLKTHCPQGHRYDAVNTRLEGGVRACRICRHAARQRDIEAYRAKDRAAARERYWRNRDRNKAVAV